MKSVVDNSVVDRLVKEGYFEKSIRRRDQGRDRSQVEAGAAVTRGFYFQARNPWAVPVPASVR